MTMKNLRFWHFVHGSPVKLTIKHGQTLNHCQGEPTDEGYSMSAVSFFHQGDKVERHDISRGRDCDGESGAFMVLHCAINKLYGRSNEYSPCGHSPAWVIEADEVYDRNAEAAGY
jgi:hypothetical protein